jgi:hypothetical protein
MVGGEGIISPSPPSTYGSMKLSCINSSFAYRKPVQRFGS